MITPRGFGPARVIALGGVALVLTWGVSGAVAQAAPVAPTAAPTAYGTSYAVIGTVALPGGGFAENPYVSADDTVYVPTGNPNYVAVLRPGVTGGVLDDSIAAAYPRAVVVSADDTVFIAEYQVQRVSAFAPGASTPAYAIATSNYPHGLAMNSDDTLVVSNFNGLTGGSVDLVSPNASTRAATISRIFGGSNPARVAVDSAGNFYVGSDSTEVKVIPSNAVAVSTTITGLSGPTQPGILPDDTLVVADRYSNSVGIIPLGSTTPSGSVPVGSTPVALAVDSLGYAYTANYGSSSISKVDPVAGTAETIITGVASTHGVVVTSTGLVYAVTNGSSMGVSVAAEVSASTTPTSGPAGSTLSVSLTGLPAGVIMDDSTVSAVWMGDDTVAFTHTAGTNAVSVVVPPGSGSASLVVEVRGGRPLTAGTFTYASAPPPAPPTPASAPRDVVALAGDGSASVSWSAPASSGSYAVSNYLVTSSPGGRTCVTVSLSCSVAGLSNGTAYTFTVKALTGAGWSAASDPSNVVTPVAPVRPSITITGSRDGKRIEVAGSSTGLGMGAVLNPWVQLAGQSAYSPGSAQVLVSMDGTFEWGRKAGKKASVYMQTPDGSVRSNTVTIRSR